MEQRKEITRVVSIALLIAAALSTSALADTTKTLTLDTADLKSLRIDKSAGELRIEGTDSGKQIEVLAEIIGDERDARLSFKKEGARAVLLSDSNSWGFFWFNNTRINLRVKVPSGLSLDIKDGSGGLILRGVAANTKIDDGSGSIEITNHRGDLDIDDGSGGIEIDSVAGSVRVKDGSGSMRIRNVDGRVSIDDGSGSITVENVTKGLTILDSGSGGLSTKNISGGFDHR